MLFSLARIPREGRLLLHGFLSRTAEVINQNLRQLMIAKMLVRAKMSEGDEREKEVRNLNISNKGVVAI